MSSIRDHSVGTIPFLRESEPCPLSDGGRIVATVALHRGRRVVRPPASPTCERGVSELISQP